MQNNATIPNWHNWIVEKNKSVFAIAAIIFLFFSTISIYTNTHFLIAIPFAITGILLTILNIQFVYFLLLIVLPISIEYTIGSFGIDLPSEPIVVLLMFFFIGYCILNFNKFSLQIFKNKIIQIILLQLFWVIITTIFAQNFIIAFKFLLAKIWFITTFFFLSIFILKNEKNMKIFFWCLFTTTFLSILFVLYNHSNYAFSFDKITNAVVPIYRNHVNYGVWIAMFLPWVFFAKTWYKKGSLMALFLNISILIICVAIYFSYTRGAWLGAISICIYYFIIKYKLTKYLLFLSTCIVVVASIYLLQNNTYLKYAPDFKKTIYHDELSDHLNATLQMEDMSVVERFNRWIAAVKMIKEKPIVGVGANNFVSSYKPYTVSEYETYISENDEKSTVHNYFLLLLAEQGIIGFLLFVFLIIIALVSCEKIYHNTKDKYTKYLVTTVACTLVVFLINNTLSDLVEANKLGSMFFMCLAIIVAIQNKKIVQNFID